MNTQQREESMSELDAKVKRINSELGFLFNARTLRREACLPCFDLDVRIWWNFRKLNRIESDTGRLVQ